MPRCPRSPRETRWGIEDEVAFLDVETTGVDPHRDRIIEIAVIDRPRPGDRRALQLARRSRHAAPARHDPAHRHRRRGMLEGAPSIETVVREVARAARAARRRRAPRVVRPHVRVRRRRARRRRAPRAGGSTRSSSPASRCRGCAATGCATWPTRSASAEPFHRAAGDVEAMFRIWRIALAGLADLAAGGRRAGGEPVAVHRLDVARHAAAGRRAAHATARHARPASRCGWRRRAGTTCRVSPTPTIASSLPRLDEVLASSPRRRGRQHVPGVRVARRAAPHGGRGARRLRARRRTSRSRRAPASGSRSPTSSPAASFALDNGLGVGVATKTNTLMDQLVHDELPRLSEALGRRAALRRRSRATSTTRVVRKIDRRSRRGVARRGGGRASRRARRVDRPVVVGRPRRGEPALDAGDEAPGRVLGGGLHPQALPLLPQPVLPARGATTRAGSAHIVVTNHALLFRDRAAAGGYPAAAALLGHRRGARGRGRGAQAAVALGRPPHDRRRCSGRCTRRAAVARWTRVRVRAAHAPSSTGHEELAQQRRERSRRASAPR